MRPDVLIDQTDGNLGRTAASEDGTTAMVVSGIAVANQFELGEVLGPFFATEEVEAIGINEAYDTDNEVLAYHHVERFFKAAGKGTKLYLMVVANTVLLSDIVKQDQPYLAKICSEKKDVKIGVATRIPDAAYVPTYEEQLDDDILLARTNAKALVTYEREDPRHRYMQVILEGYDWQGNPSLSLDLRTLDSDRVTIVIGADNDISTKDVGGNTPYLNYAFAGYFAGIRAGLHVGRNAGRVKNGALDIDNAGLSNGALMNTFKDTQENTLNGFGYVFAWGIEQKEGFYINDDHVCTSLESDYAYSPDGRVADKVSRITREVYVEELLDDVEINPATGGLSPAVAKSFQERLEKVCNQRMINKQPKEASAITAYVNEEQNILATSKIETETDIVPLGTSRTITVKQSFSNPFNN